MSEPSGTDATASGKVYKGHCYCRRVSWEVTGKAVRSAYCHCTLCQRLTGAVFIHTIHFPESAFKWTHGLPSVDAGAKTQNPSSDLINDTMNVYAVEDKPWKKRYYCKNCGACIGSFHEKHNRRSLWGMHFERDEEGKIKDWEDIKPTSHMFYGTRVLDVQDELPKWAGYEEQSERLG